MPPGESAAASPRRPDAAVVDSGATNRDTARPLFQLTSFEEAADVSQRPFLFRVEPMARLRASVVRAARSRGVQAVRQLHRAQLRLRAAGGFRLGAAGAPRRRRGSHSRPQPSARAADGGRQRGARGTPRGISRAHAGGARPAHQAQAQGADARRAAAEGAAQVRPHDRAVSRERKRARGRDRHPSLAPNVFSSCCERRSASSTSSR